MGPNEFLEFALLNELARQFDELCQLIRKRYPASQLPIIAVSGRFQEIDDKTEGLELGLDDYLSKPFDPQELLARIANLERRSPHSGGAPPDA